jgi:hypothetical protein
MKRLALAAAAIAAVASLTSCSDDSDSGDSAPDPSTSASESASEEPTDEASEEATDEATDEPTEDTEGDAERFATAYDQVSTLFTSLNSQEGEADPTNADEANAAAGLDETTPLIFADFSVLPDDTGGSLCLESDTGTYIAVTSAGSEGEIDLGDGECSYETSDAVVVGDVATDTWTTGAEYMGELLPTGIFGS